MRLAGGVVQGQRRFRHGRVVEREARCDQPAGAIGMGEAVAISHGFGNETKGIGGLPDPVLAKGAGGADKACVGVMQVTRTAQPDGPDGKWASVAVAPVAALASPVTLATIKGDARLAGLEMIRQSRLSVSPVGDAEWQAIINLAGGTKN